MTLKNVKYSSDSSQSTLRDLKDGECGGCGTFDNVTDNCCEECGEGYPDPSEQDVLDANDYYEHHVKPPHRNPEIDAMGMWKKSRAPVDYSLEAELAKQQQDAVNSSENKPFDPPKGTGKAPANFDLKGLNKWIGEGGLKRGELSIIASHNPFKR